MYRLVLESLLGVRLQVDADGAMLVITPCVPSDWKSYAIDYRFRATTFHLQIELLDDDAAAQVIELDGLAVSGQGVPLVDDTRPHTVLVRRGRGRPRRDPAP
jgi:cellobiose phosphorylase